MSIATAGGARSTSSVHSPHHQSDSARARTPRDRAKSIVLAIAGIAGVLSVLWLIASVPLGLAVIVFKTGSMAPTIPTGSMAITHSVPASEIKVGDVVTVPVPGKVLPVTHRVVSIARVPSLPNDRSLVLKGDDNLTADQTPYVVGIGKVVIFSLPVAGTVIALFQTPPFIGLVFLAVAGLLLWAFWPAREEQNSTVRAQPAKHQRSKGNDHESVR
jgi:signal peptidase I